MCPYVEAGSASTLSFRKTDVLMELFELEGSAQRMTGSARWHGELYPLYAKSRPPFGNRLFTYACLAQG